MDETAVELQFGDGTYRFWLPMNMINELERGSGRVFLNIDHSIRESVGRDGEGNWVFMGGGSAHTSDILEVIRLGLIGGNHGLVNGEQVEVGPLRARELCRLYCYPARPLEESVMQAFYITTSAVVGVSLKKKMEAAHQENQSHSEKGR